VHIQYGFELKINVMSSCFRKNMLMVDSNNRAGDNWFSTGVSYESDDLYNLDTNEETSMLLLSRDPFYCRGIQISIRLLKCRLALFIGLSFIFVHKNVTDCNVGRCLCSNLPSFKVIGSTWNSVTLV